MPMTLARVAVMIFGFAAMPVQQPTQQVESPSQSNLPAGGGTPSLVRRSEEDRRRASLLSHEVVLNVLVTDGAGKAVGDLKEEDFTILENGRAEPLSFFRMAQPPHVVLVLDAVNSSRWSYAAERRAIEKYLRDETVSLPFPIAIGWLSNADIHVNSESQDPKTLLDQVRAAPSAQSPANSEQQSATQGSDVVSLSRRADGALPVTGKIDLGLGGAGERFLLSVNALTTYVLRQKDAPGRFVVVWLGSGWPLLTGPGFLADTAEYKTSFFERIADLSNDLRDAEITLNVVASPDVLRVSGLDKGYYAPFLGAVTGPEQASTADLALPVLAVHSGGKVFDQDKDMASAIALCLEGIRSWYMLAFQSQPSKQPDDYRALQVTIDRPGVIIRTTTGYYAQP